MKKALLTDDECWLRVQARDASADGRFVFVGANHRRFLSALLVARSGRYVKIVRFFVQRAAGAGRRFSPLQALSAG